MRRARPSTGTHSSAAEPAMTQTLDPTTPDTRSSPAPAPDTGRDSQGRFTRNNKGGPGTPSGRQTARLRQVLLECVSEDDLRAMIATVKEKALEGDLGAVKLLLSYVVGKPAPMVDPDTLDIQEVELFQREAVPGPVVTTALKESIPAPLACVMLREGVPAVASNLANHLLGDLAQLDERDRQKAEQEQKAAARKTEKKAAGEGETAKAKKDDRTPQTRPANDQTVPGPTTKDSGKAKEAVIPEAELPTVEQILAFLRHTPPERIAELAAED